MTLNEKNDLTRWNRAGLSRFRYVDGNAVTFLETLRLQLAEEFDQSGRPQWPELIERFPERAGETRLQTRKRLKKQYYDDRRDYAWEILRSFARSSHILGEYINAYGNEAYLSTAVEWDNVRKLLGLLDYRPSPPASAQTYIALFYKENTSGKVDKGFAVKNKPGEGEQTIIFETRDTVVGNDTLNQLHLLQWDQNPEFLAYDSATRKILFYLDEAAQDISIGDKGILAGESSAMGVEVSFVAGRGSEYYVELVLEPGNSWTPLTLHEATLYLKPSFISSPLANGENSVLLEKHVAVAKDEILFIDGAYGWKAVQVSSNQLAHMAFEQNVSASDSGKNIHRARIVKRQRHNGLKGGDPIHVLPEEMSDGFKFFVDRLAGLRSISTTHYKVGDPGEKVKIFYVDTGGTGYAGDLLYPDESAMGSILQVQPEPVRFSGKPPKIKTGDWVLIHLDDDTIEACRVEKISTDEDWFKLELNPSCFGISLLEGVFEQILKHKDGDLNSEQAWSSESTDAVTILELDNANVSEHLVLGKKMICASDSQAFVVDLKEVSVTGSLQISVSPPFHYDPLAAGFTRNNTKVFGNVAKAGHGETQPQKIIGSGDASKPNQIFALPSDQIAWVADAGFSTGVRADIDLTVGQRQWQQVEDLSLSSAEDHHFQVKVDEDSRLSVCFGDGRQGRRLPTGIDNVRVRYRDGYGESGNLEAGSLVKILKPHSLIDNFAAPLASSGGAEKEAGESMRENGPATVLAMKRAVSLDDFTHLAAHHSMVWQAQAFEKMPDRPGRSLIEVVVVAAGGEPFAPGSDTALLIQNYLSSHCIPGTPVSVVSYSPLFMKLEVTLMVDETAWDKNQVGKNAAEYLKDNLNIRQRRLGQPLFRSEVIALLEQVEGVENSHCTILSDPFDTMDAGLTPRLHRDEQGLIRKVAVQPFQLLCLDIDQVPMQIISRDYEI
ncbi:baseplate J/gp47 family protein [Desulfobacter curvatus]|uniref:baseplate J/gp47 family protein n=1 Tax=Desulfobacter curvatus TaxID=2290 RepID=UPI00035D62C1|nr:hypothetical protein [Desulfobacter curvatus]